MPFTFIIISLFLYYFSPNEYSFSYCVILHCLFLFYAIYLYMTDRCKEKIGFNLLFSFAFYFTNFIYPVFVYPVEPEYSLFQFDFNYDIITKSTALAFIAYVFYGYGYKKIKSKIVRKQHLNNSILCFSNTFNKRLICLFIIYIIIFILVGGLDIFASTYSGKGDSNKLLPKLMNIFLFPLTIHIIILILYTPSVKRQNIIYLILILISLVLMVVGTRTYPLMALIGAFYIFCNTRKIPNYLIGSTIVLGVLFMSFIGDVRSMEIFNFSEYSLLETSSSIGWYDKLSDLIINNRNLYVFYDYVNTHGYTYGLTMMGNLLSPIPFLQSLFVKLTGIPDYLLTSPTFSTYLTLGLNPSFGLGTNAIGDVYLSFGLVGVVVLFYLLGYLVAYIREMTYKNSYYHTIAYMVFLSNSIYFCRASFFGSIRVLIWSLIIGWFFCKYYNKYK